MYLYRGTRAPTRNGLDVDKKFAKVRTCNSLQGNGVTERKYGREEEKARRKRAARTNYIFVVAVGDLCCTGCALLRISGCRGLC